ncbi:hypothetical protein ACEUW3_07690 [Staphylococcus pseudintermedius]|uniref:PVL orf 52-like protein n=2 Tax=Staphylococcus intermedius TaxID=1285 RepID=A0A380G7P0_STAIN|nr:hypothetical protein [Staphylococcus intermedius]PCF87419.1 hypothetical protein B4W76_03250 [Staphylococcus intermedius]PNZ52253.1 hypothetical protein CD138_07025 [Staphylococcus intermedius NCTC 11048]SUM47085.1 PVL orf 52-like protein [Staphylococcus intermedius NCTC 11048]
MKIKKKVEMNLAGLIRWAWENDVKGKIFISKRGKKVEFYSEGPFNVLEPIWPHDVFTVEAEEEITVDTVIPMLVETYLSSKGEPSCYSYRNKSINYILENNKYYNNMPPKYIYMLNDDMTMTLIWKDGEMV